MTIGVKDAKDGIEKARAAAQTTQDYIDKAKKITESGGTISTIQNFSKILDGIGKANFALGVISMGLDLVIFLSNEPGPEAKILNMLDEISNQITQLEERIEKKFKWAAEDQDFKTANNSRREASSNLEAYFKILRNYNGYISDNPNPANYDYNGQKALLVLKKDLLNIKTDAILKEVQKFATLSQSDIGIKGIFDLALDYSNGNIKVIIDLGNSMLNYTIAAMQLDAAIHTIEDEIEAKEEGRALDKDESAKSISELRFRLYEPIIKQITDCFREAINYCTTYRNEINKYAKIYIEKGMLPSLTETDLTFCANLVGQKLAEQWFHYSWAVIAFIYKDKRQKGYTYVSAGSSFYMEKKVKDGTLMIIVSKIDKEAPVQIEKLKPFYKEARSRHGHNNRYFDFTSAKTEFYEKEYNNFAMLWLYDDGNLPAEEKAEYGFYTSTEDRVLQHFWGPKNMSSWIDAGACNSVIHA